MNDVAYVEASRKLAERMMAEAGQNSEDRLAWGWRLVLGRRPKPEETRILANALHRFQSRFVNDQQAAVKLLSEGDAPRNPNVDVAELAAYTGVASLILNLDEAITKE